MNAVEPLWRMLSPLAALCRRVPPLVPREERRRSRAGITCSRPRCGCRSRASPQEQEQPKADGAGRSVEDYDAGEADRGPRESRRPTERRSRRRSRRARGSARRRRSRRDRNGIRGKCQGFRPERDPAAHRPPEEDGDALHHRRADDGHLFPRGAGDLDEGSPQAGG